MTNMKKNVGVFTQDQTTKPFDFFFTKIIGIPNTVAVTTAIDDFTVTVTDATGMSESDYFGLFNADNPNDNRAYFGTILSISDDDITLDTPLDFAFQAGDTAAVFNKDLSVDGSSTSQVFSIQVGSAATQSIHINRLLFSMLTDSAVSLAKFGDLTKLVKGCVLRRKNGICHNVFNIKNNSDLANLCFDYDPQAAANPSQGQDGVTFRYTFNGKDKHGVAILH